MLQVTPDKRLAKLRRQAKKRGLRVLGDRCGNYTVVSAGIEPQRPLLGLDHVPLWTIEQAIFAPLPEPPPRRQRMPRPAPAQADHSFLALVETLKAAGGAS
jgi:hypothetical protein